MKILLFPLGLQFELRQLGHLIGFGLVLDRPRHLLRHIDIFNQHIVQNNSIRRNRRPKLILDILLDRLPLPKQLVVIRNCTTYAKFLY